MKVEAGTELLLVRGLDVVPLKEAVSLKGGSGLTIPWVG